MTDPKPVQRIKAAFATAVFILVLLLVKDWKDFVTREVDE